MLKVVDAETPDMILHCGDHKKDCDAVSYVYPDIPLRSVKGNCDRFTPGTETDEFTLCDKRFFMTHGHLFGVKNGTEYLIKSAFEHDTDVLLFGHTHIPHYSVIDDLVVINPGSMGGAGKSYAVLYIKNGVISCELKNLNQNFIV